MTRFALLIEYHGAAFCGWQRQADDLAVQQVLEQAAEQLAGGPVASVVAGRTDAGVHAQGQVAHIDLDRDIAPEKLVQALNFHMKPHLVSVLRAAIVPPGWNARFSAIGRSYRYDILHRRARPALSAGLVWHLPHRLDAGAMQIAANHLLGRHDFSSFRAASCQANSPWRTLDRLDVEQEGEMIRVHAHARSFLHHQVRNIVGSLKLVGDGSWPAERMQAVLAAAKRAAAGPTAPPEGLFLVRVIYPEQIFK